jgi:PncC family amidohydrolase
VDLKIIRHINRIFGEKNLTLSVAESCTGGLISHYLTAVPGASSFFEAGVVTYSAAAKKKLLGMSQTVFATHGMVSEETARLMAKKVRLLTGTDVGVSTTGNLGPDVLEGKPKGLVYIAISTRKETVIRKCMFKGSRGHVKEQAVRTALAFLSEVIGSD